MASMVIEASTRHLGLVRQGIVLDRMPRAAAETSASTCSCGQALDCTHAAHCPRCGVSLHV